MEDSGAGLRTGLELIPTKTETEQGAQTHTRVSEWCSQENTHVKGRKKYGKKVTDLLSPNPR